MLASLRFMFSSPTSDILKTTILIQFAVVTRLAVSISGAPKLLVGDHQLSSPLTSFSQFQEGLYLFKHGIDPYDGGTFRHSPLLLALFSVLPTSTVLATSLWISFDAIAAWALVKTWRARQNVSSSPRDFLVAIAYLVNPYNILPSVAFSTSSLENALLLLAVMFTSTKKASPALLSLALLSHLSPTSALYLPPLLLVLLTDPHSHLASPRKVVIKTKLIPALLGEFIAYGGVLTLASALIAGSWRWIPQTWGTWFSLPDLTPNVGLWWYFFTEMFDHFRPFFLMVFNVHLLIYVAPLCIKFQYDPLYAVFILTGVLGTFKAYPTLADTGLFLTMISLFPETYPYLRYPIVTSLLHLHSALLLPLFHHLWLTQGTGNANFYYASTLVFACSNGAVIIDSLFAGMRIAIGKPEVEGYSVAQE